MSTTVPLAHESYCLPRPGEKVPPTETYTATRNDPNTGLPVASVRVDRCIQCGAAAYDGVPHLG